MCSAYDHDFKIEQRLQAIFAEEVPFKNTQYDENPESQYDTNNGICYVYISNFFTDRTNLVYYIKGTQNVTRFIGGSFGMQAYDGPMLCTVNSYQNSYILKFTNVDKIQEEKVIKDDIPMGRLRWQYLFETGRLAWSKMEFDENKATQVKEMEVDNEEFEMVEGIRLSDNEMDADSDDDEGKGGTSLTESRLVSQSIEPVMSAKKKDKVKALEVKERLVSNGMFKIRLGSSASSTNVKPSRGARNITEVHQADPRAVTNHKNIEAFKNVLRLDSIDEIWAELKTAARRDRHDGTKLHATVEELAKEVTILERREEELVQKQVPASSIGGNSEDVAELAELEINIAADRHHLVQRFANASAHNRKQQFANKITREIHSLQNNNANKHQIKIYLMGLLLKEGHDESRTETNPLETEEIETVIKIVDIIGLQEDLEYKIHELEIDDNNSEELARLGKLGTSFEVDLQGLIEELAGILFKHNSDTKLGNVLFVAGRKEVVGERLTAYEHNLVARVMDATNQNEHVALDLLRRSWWHANAAVSLWFEPPELPTKLKLNTHIPTSASLEGSPLLSSPESPSKRSYNAEAGPSNPSKRRRTQSLDLDASRTSHPNGKCGTAGSRKAVTARVKREWVGPIR
jgi:hypothetical protein